MKVSLWLAWKELLSRRVSFAIAVGTIAGAVAVCATGEFVSRSRRVAVSAQIDVMGPRLRIVPPGLSSTRLARFDVGRSFLSTGIARALEEELARWIRAVDARLLLAEDLLGSDTPLIGIQTAQVVSPFAVLRELKRDEAALGAELARRLRKEPGEILTVKGRPLRIVASLPPSGTVDDIALFLPLESLQELAGLPGAVNEIRLFPYPGAEAAAARYLSARHPGLKVLHSALDDEARHDADRLLDRHRWMLYLTTGLIAAFSILIWAHLNSSERRLEMATLVAIGGSRRAVLSILGARGTIVALMGGILGYAAAAAIALAQDYQSSQRVIWSWQLLSA